MIRIEKSYLVLHHLLPYGSTLITRGLRDRVCSSLHRTPIWSEPSHPACWSALYSPTQSQTVGSPRATHSVWAPFLHAALTGLGCVRASLQRGGWVSTELSHGLSPSQSMWPRYQAAYSRSLLKGTRFPRHSRSHHSAITGQARPREAQHTSPLPGTRTYCASPMDTETGLGSVFKALITSMQSVLVTHLLLVLC